MSLSARRTVRVICILGIIIFFGGLFFYRDWMLFAMFSPGLVLGEFVSVANVSVMDGTLASAAAMPRRKGRVYCRFMGFCCFVASVLLLAVIYLYPIINLIGAVIGVLLFPIAWKTVRFLEGTL